MEDHPNSCFLIHIDISVYTTKESIGRISGIVELRIIPMIGDNLMFDMPEEDLVLRNGGNFTGSFDVTRRAVWTSDISKDIHISLGDLVMGSVEDALKIMAFFEERYQLIAERFD
jgi:hypothetical protein